MLLGKAVAGRGIRLLVPETGISAMAVMDRLEAPARLGMVLDKILAVLTVFFLEFFHTYRLSITIPHGNH